MPYAQLPDFRMFYTDEGEGQPVLLVHGFSCDGSDWSWQIPALRPDHRVITVDLRGHGHSEAPPAGYNPRSFAADVAALLKQREVGPVVAMGHSMGGLVVAALAVEHPDLVRAIVLVDSALGIDPAGIPQLRQLIAGLESPACYQVAEGLFRNSFYPPACPPHLAELHVRRLLAVPQHVLAQSFAGFINDSAQFTTKPEAEAYLARVEVPGLCFRAGRNDPQAVAAWERGQLRHPYSKAVAWEGTGHFLQQERPAEFNAITKEWMAGLPA